MDFEGASLDPAADFLSREKEVLGDLQGEINLNNDEAVSEPRSSSDDFVMVNNDEEESFAGMQIPSNMPVQKEIPEKIRMWQENQTLMLEKKDKDEQESIERLRNEGKEELTKWIENNKTNLEKTKANNRMNDTNMTNGNEISDNNNEIWKSIYELCEFSQQKIKNGRDTTRMKSIFLQMKQNPLNKTP